MNATALFDAIRNGDGPAVSTLLASDPALAGARNGDGASPALWAVYTRHPELAVMVLAGREPDFLEACALGNRERVSALLAGDATLANAYSGDGFTPLGLAIFFGHEDLARQLVAAGADVDRPSRNTVRVAPLHSAIASGSAAMVTLLLEQGAHPDCEALPSAAGHGSREMVETLLAAGADCLAKTKDGKTAEDLARQYGHAELANWLAHYSSSPAGSDGT